MNLKQRFLLKASIGFAAGVVVDLIIHAAYIISGNSFLLAGSMDKTTALRFLLELFLAGVLGVVGNGGSVIYEIESWSILKATGTHFILAYGTFLAIGTINGWLTPGFTPENIIVAGIVFAVYVMIWLIQYLVYKREVRDINNGIRLLRSKGEGAA
ncbi:MAG: DUF3021 domain-containing protein [Lachnospiraceae bacterium]|nr:DUF3021 domain-containing protein [Lachnospiraceae bacterium]